MKKKHKSLARRHRNAVSGRELASRAGRAVSSGARSVGRRLTAPNPPSWQDVIATVAAGGGAAALGGYMVRKGVDPKIVSTGMLVGGLGGAFATSGTLRTAMTSIAGAGAGQLALTLMQEKAINDLKKAMTAAATAEKPAAAAAGSNVALPPSSFENRLALHAQLAEDAARFTEPEAELYYADAAA